MGMIRPTKLSTINYSLAAIFIFLFQFMHEPFSLAFCVCAHGLCIGARPVVLTLIYTQFYGKELLAPALAMENNFYTIGTFVSPMIFSSLLDVQSFHTVAWDIGAISCLAAAGLTLAAGHLNWRNGPGD